MKSNIHILNKDINKAMAQFNKREIKRLKKLGRTNKEIAEELHVTEARISQLLNK